MKKKHLIQEVPSIQCFRCTAKVYQLKRQQNEHTKLLIVPGSFSLHPSSFCTFLIHFRVNAAHRIAPVAMAKFIDDSKLSGKITALLSSCIPLHIPE
jgi:hypothetical protein